MTLHSFIHFHARFCSGEGRGAEAPGELEIAHGQQQSQISNLLTVLKYFTTGLQDFFSLENSVLFLITKS